MNLRDILDGATVLIDANILIYAFEEKSVRCREFLERCAHEAVFGVSTTVILAEVCHRLMINEARRLGLASSPNPARSLGQRPADVAQLSAYAKHIRSLLDSDMTFETVSPADFHLALELQRQHRLLTNDSLNLAVAKRLSIHEIATADAHFDAVQGLIVYKPNDLNP